MGSFLFVAGGRRGVACCTVVVSGARGLQDSSTDGSLICSGGIAIEMPDTVTAGVGTIGRVTVW